MSGNHFVERSKRSPNKTALTTGQKTVQIVVPCHVVPENEPLEQVHVKTNGVQGFLADVRKGLGAIQELADLKETTVELLQVDVLLGYVAFERHEIREHVRQAFYVDENALRLFLLGSPLQ